MRPRVGWLRTTVTFTITAVAVGLATPTAQAFFPPWWPQNPKIGDNPSDEPPIFNPRPPHPDPFPPDPTPKHPEPPTDCDPPTGVPEPSTLAGATVGLVVVGWVARRRCR